MIVVDATIWVDLLCNTLDGDPSVLLADECVSPVHVGFEVGNALLRAERHGVIPAGVAGVAIDHFTRLPIERVYHADDARNALAFLDNATYADAWYLALAERLACPILTSDKGMAATARIHDIAVVGADE